MKKVENGAFGRGHVVIKSSRHSIDRDGGGQSEKLCTAFTLFTFLVSRTKFSR